MALVARGEFSIVIAGLGAGLEPQLGPLAAAYVLFLAVLGPVLARAAQLSFHDRFVLTMFSLVGLCFGMVVRLFRGQRSLLLNPSP
jgi:Kef-type K+ transport system membrane component KefB